MKKLFLGFLAAILLSTQACAIGLGIGAVASSLPPAGALPTQSLSFTGASSMYLSRSGISSATSTVCAVSMWIRPTATVLNQQPLSSGNQKMSLQFSVATQGDVWFAVKTNNVNSHIQTNLGSLITAGAWNHIYAFMDSTQVTSTDRLQIYVNGTRAAIAGGSSYPNLNDVTSWAPGLAANYGYPEDTFPTTYYSGLINQPALFVSSIPSINQVYGSGGHQLDVTGLSGLISLLNTNTSVAPLTTDFVGGASFTNNNGVSTSATIPPP